MSTGAQFAYVQSRLQARHGQRLTETAWRLLETTDDLAGYLQAARGTFFRVWIYHLAAGSDTHEIERSLRQDWARYCADVSAWLPAGWRRSVRWISTLNYLPMITHLVRGEPVWHWMQEDTELAPLAIPDQAVRREALGAGRYAALAAAIENGTLPLTAWLRCWLELASGNNAADMQAMRDIARFAGQHVNADMQRPAPSPARRREDLQIGLTRFFRRWAGGIGAVFAHLGLVALDTERLQAGLVLRAVMPGAVGRPSWA